MKSATPAGLARGLGSSRLSAFARSSTQQQQQQQRRVVTRYKENDNDSENLQTFDLMKEELEQKLKQDAAAQDVKQQPLQPLVTPAEPNLSPQQLKAELEEQLKQDAAAQDVKQQPLQPLFTPAEPKLSPQQLREVRLLLVNPNDCF
jgi:hypothetical protein